MASLTVVVVQVLAMVRDGAVALAPHAVHAAALAPTLLVHPRHRARQQQLLIPDQYVTQRADAAQRVEAQVQEVSQIFGRVADLIKDQGESVERIEVNVESAAADVEAAEGELMDRLDNMGGNLVIGLKVGGIVLATMVAYVILV